MKKRKFAWRKLIRLLFYMIICIFAFASTIQMLAKVNYNAKDTMIIQLLDSSNNLKEESLIEKIVDYVLKLDLLKPSKLISSSSAFFEKENEILEEEEVITVFGEKQKELPKEEIKKEDSPILYLYNTHQREEYKKGSTKTTPSVLGAASFLQQELKKKEIYSVVEKTDVNQILNVNGWNYANSYRVTRMLLEQAKKDYNNLEYYIDLHRDSISKKLSTITINGTSYAKILFVLGLEQENYKKNLVLMEALDAKINQKYKGLSRGIYKKEGPGVNGIYNQDFDENCILIEVGGAENTMDEVENTLRVLSEVLSEYIKEQQ